MGISVTLECDYGTNKIKLLPFKTGVLRTMFGNEDSTFWSNLIGKNILNLENVVIIN